MSEIDEKIDQLQMRLENLVKYQEEFQREISQIHYDINVLRSVQQKQSDINKQEPSTKSTELIYFPKTKTTEIDSQPPPPKKQTNQAQHHTNPIFSNSENYQNTADFQTEPNLPEVKSNLEKFIGENLINKVGIVILVLGVAIGAKYAIDNNLISPLMRIILGYVFGIGLNGLAVRLKPKYHNFSSVLVSGGMAIMYFITFAAYIYYDLITQPTAFVLMLIFTVFTVLTAIIYDRVIIAQIGLVGAYTIPFLLSQNSGRIDFLFTYIAIINAGILALSVKKYWKSLFYSSFIITWLVFTAWYLTDYETEIHLNLGLVFSTVFFFIFYLTFLSYKALYKKEISLGNISLVLSNSFIYYGFGYSIINSLPGGNEYLGLFTAANAGFHFLIAFLLSRLEIVHKSVLYLPSALILVFITITVPVQFEGNWITLAWTAESVILFSIGRTKRLPLYEYFSYPLMAAASLSLLKDWLETADKYYYNEAVPYPIFNVSFLTAILFVTGFVIIYSLNRNERYEPLIRKELHDLIKFVIPTILLLALYNTFRTEIGNYFYYEIINTAVGDTNQTGIQSNRNLELFNIIWQINYTILFLSFLAFLNIKKFRSAALGFVNLGLNAAVLLTFLSLGLFVLGNLRENYLLQSGAGIFSAEIFKILIRYVSLVFAGVLIFSIYKYTKQEFIQKYVSEIHLDYAFEFLFYFSLWIVISSELINWMDIFGYADSYKLGLSILWGIYALLLIIIGINQNKKQLRIGAIFLFGITLAKLFFYDIADLDTISKTVVFVSLGILMLIVSFLYNKYKHLIFEVS